VYLIDMDEKMGKPKITPKIVQKTFGHKCFAGKGTLNHAKAAPPIKAATAQRAKASQIGSISRTARRVIGSVSENINTPTSPRSMPKFSRFDFKMMVLN
jgi:hypothetical protein